MNMTFEQQNAYLDNVDALQARAKELADEATVLYAQCERMACELNTIRDEKTFHIKFRAYEALLKEADTAADAANLARNMARTALVKFIDEEQTILH